MRVLFVLSGRRAFRCTRHKHTVLQLCRVSVRWLALSGCHSLGSRLPVFSHPDRAFLDVSPSWRLSLPGERRQRRPGSKTWRLTVLAEGVSCRTVGSFSLSLSLSLPRISPTRQVTMKGRQDRSPCLRLLSS